MVPKWSPKRGSNTTGFEHARRRLDAGAELSGSLAPKARSAWAHPSIRPTAAETPCKSVSAPLTRRVARMHRTTWSSSIRSPASGMQNALVGAFSVPCGCASTKLALRGLRARRFRHEVVLRQSRGRSWVMIQGSELGRSDPAFSVRPLGLRPSTKYPAPEPHHLPRRPLDTIEIAD